MNPFLMAFLRTTSLILNDTVTKKTENNRLQNQQYRHSDNDDYNPLAKIHKTTNPYHFDTVEREDRDGRKCYEITRYKGHDTDVHFPEYIDNLPVRIIGTDIFKRKIYNTDKWEIHWVEQVWIPKTVILIKDRAFKDCKELEKIHFEGDVPEIQPNAFLRCNKLVNPPPLQEYITEPWRKPESYNTQNPTVFETERISGRNAVRITKICSYQNEIIVPEKIDGLPVVKITGGVQRDRDERRQNNGNYTLKKIYFPDSVEEISEMAFLNCWGLESIRLPNNAGLVLCNASFWNCVKLRLENVTFPDGKDFSDYMYAFGACTGMSADYHRKMCLKHEQVRQSKQEKPYISENNSESTDKFVVVSEKYNNIYDALHYYDYVIIDNYEKIDKSCAWLLNYVDTCNIVFRDGSNTAVIPIIGNYKRYPDSLINERLELYKNCIENTTTDGKFFDTGFYDENILNLLPSMKRKLDVCYYRLSSGYRLSPEHSAMYEKFVRKHAKKSVYRSIDTNDRKRLEWCRKSGLINRHYNAVLEYAKRKNNADILE